MDLTPHFNDEDAYTHWSPFLRGSSMHPNKRLLREVGVSTVGDATIWRPSWMGRIPQPETPCVKLHAWMSPLSVVHVPTIDARGVGRLVWKPVRKTKTAPVTRVG